MIEFELFILSTFNLSVTKWRKGSGYELKHINDLWIVWQGALNHGS